MDVDETHQAMAYAQDSLEPILGANTALRDLNIQARQFGRTISDAFARAVVDGRRFEDVLRSAGQRLSEIALKAAFKPLELALSQGFESLAKAAMGPMLQSLGGNLLAPQALGGVVAGGLVQPFADGGVVAAPTYFPLGRGLGLMGERGAEAILPLARGPDGRLGVRAGGGGRPVSVTVNVATPDADSFRRSEAQVAAAVARAVARGRRAL